MDKLLEKLKALAGRRVWSDRLGSDGVVDDLAGENVDDAFAGGQADGETILARELLELLDQPAVEVLPD